MQYCDLEQFQRINKINGVLHRNVAFYPANEINFGMAPYDISLASNRQLTVKNSVI